MSQEFLDFDDVKIKPKFKEKYKGVPGEKHRLSIVYPKEGSEGKVGPFVMRNTHFHEKYFLCKEDICCDKLGPSKVRLACIVVKYKTNKDGTIKKNDSGIPFDFEILPWILSDKKFNQLKSLHTEWDLRKHDIMVTCGGTEQYQDLDFTPCKESVWQLKEEFKTAVFTESEPTRKDLARELGMDLSLDEIKELLNMGIEQPAATIASEAELTDILSEV